MDSFKIVLIILTVFLIYCYLKNNGYFKEDIIIFEGMNPTGFCSSGDPNHNSQDICEQVNSGDCPIPERSQIPNQPTTTGEPCIWTPIDPSSVSASVSVGQVVASERPVPNPSGSGNDDSQALSYNVTNSDTLSATRAEVDAHGNPIYGTNTVLADATIDPSTGMSTPMSPTDQDTRVTSTGVSTQLQGLINNLLQNSRPGGGLCRRVSDGVELPGDWTEESCTGFTGNELIWKTRDELVDSLNGISPPLPENLKNDILSIKPGDVFSKTADGQNIFQYRDTATGNITDTSLSIPLLPWNNEGYCLKEPIDINWYNSAVDPGVSRISSEHTNKEDCENVSGQLWITPTNTVLLDNNIRQNRCGISISEAIPGPGDGTGGDTDPDCKSQAELYYPYCQTNDGQEIMSKDWWKQRWRPGWSYEDICVGKDTGNTWQSNQDLANLMGGEVLNYMVARHGTSVYSAGAQDDTTAAGELRDLMYEDLLRASGDSATAAAQLEVIREEIERVRNLPCDWSSAGTPPQPYTGNYEPTSVNMSGTSSELTANGYVFEDRSQALTATNLTELSFRDPTQEGMDLTQARAANIQRNPAEGAVRNQLSCNVSGGFSRTPNGPLNPSVNCISDANGQLKFNFSGCSAHACTMPDNNPDALTGNAPDAFHSGLYEFLDGTPLNIAAGDPVDINTFMDTRTMTPRIRCSTGPTATNPDRVFASLKPTHQGGVQITCPQPDPTGTSQPIQIDGCSLSQCTAPTVDVEKYFINSTIDPARSIDISTLYRDNHWAQNINHIRQIEDVIDQSGNTTDGRLVSGERGHRFNVCGADTDIPETPLFPAPAQPGNTPNVREGNTATPGINPNIWNNKFKQPCFSCKAPNYFKVDDANRPAVADMNSYWTGVLNEELADTGEDSQWWNASNELEQYNYGAKASCENPGSAIELSGCFENKCLNPGNENYKRVYDGEKRIKVVAVAGQDPTWTLQKPRHMEDTVRLSVSAPTNDTEGHYQKYAINDPAPFASTASDTVVRKSDIVPSGVGASSVAPFKCGNNYSRTDPASTDNIISSNEIKCYNWFDHKNRQDELNVDVPDYIVGNVDELPEAGASPINLDEIASADLGSHPDIRNNYISLSGCEENLCKWPRSAVGYDKPRNRGQCNQTISPTSSENIIPCSIADADVTGARGVLGYFTGTPNSDVNEQEYPFPGGHDDSSTEKSNFIYPDPSDTEWRDVSDANPNSRDFASVKTAREWANIDISGLHVNNIDANNQIVTTHSITCLGANERTDQTGPEVINECSVGYKGNKEIAWSNIEIDEMVSEAATACDAGGCGDQINKGQPMKKNPSDGSDIPMTSQDLQSVGRGGPWSISRCWKNATPDVNPKVSCSRDTNASQCRGLRDSLDNSVKNTCNDAIVEGCQQKRCKLNPLHAKGGTRILIQTSDEQTSGTGTITPATYLSIGGPKQDNIDELFNVDQIRQITCDYNHSKRNPMNDFGDVICKVDGGFFEITNTCAQTQCEGIKIVDTQHISDTGYRGEANNQITPTSENSEFSRGPGIPWGSSRTNDWYLWSQTPNADLNLYALSSTIGNDPGMISPDNNIGLPGGDGRRAANDPQFKLAPDAYSPYISGFPVGGGGCSTTLDPLVDLAAFNAASERCNAYVDQVACNQDNDCIYSLGDNTFPGRYDTGIGLNPVNVSWASIDVNEDIFNYDLKNYSNVGTDANSTFNPLSIQWGHTCTPGALQNDPLCGNPYADNTEGELHPQGVRCRMSNEGAAAGGGAGNPDEITNVVLPVGGSKDDPEPLITCNYEAGNDNLPNIGESASISDPNTWTKPKYKLSHCQRKICTYPNLREPSGTGTGNIYDGYRYVGSRPGNINETSQPSTCVPNDTVQASLASDPVQLQAAQNACNTGFNPNDSSTCTGDCRFIQGVSWTGKTDSVNNVLGYEYGGQQDGAIGTSGDPKGGDINILYGDISDSDKEYLRTLRGGQDEFGNIGPDVPLFRPESEYSPYDGLSDVNLNAFADMLSLNDFFGGPNATDNLTNSGQCETSSSAAPNAPDASGLTTRAECISAGHTWRSNNPGYRNKVGASIQCDNRNWYGVPNVKCGQTSDNYLNNDKPNFNFDGCKENTCLIPKKQVGGLCLPPEGGGTTDQEAAAAAAQTETECPGPLRWIGNNINGTMYNALSPEEKEKWDRVERGYIWPTGTVETGTPFKTKFLRVNDSTDEQAESDVKCNINFRKNTLNLHKIRCPSFRADGSLPQYDENGEIVQLPSVLAKDNTTKASDKFGFFTNVVSHKSVPSGGVCNEAVSGTCAYESANLEEEPLRDNDGVLVSRHQGLPGEPIDSPRCIENKCKLDPTLACSMDTLHGLDSNVYCDEKYNWRSTNAGQYNGTSNLDSELPGYVFNFYKNSADGGGSEKVEIDVLDIHNQSLTGAELETLSAGNHNHPDSTGVVGTRETYPAKLQNAIDYPHTVHQLGGNAGLSCAPNYHSRAGEDPKITCGANPGTPESRDSHEDANQNPNFDSSHNDTSGKFVLSGCYENYCELPSIQDPNTIKYTYTGDNLSNLTNLSVAQGGKITLRQFNKGQGNTLRCAPWTEPIGGKCMNIETAAEWREATDANNIPITDSANCNLGNCVDPSGTDIPSITTEADCNGVNRWIPSVEWIDFTGPRVSCPEHNGVFRFYGCEESVLPMEASGSFYYSPYPGDCIGFWPGSLSYISVAGPNGITIDNTDYAEGEPIGIGSMPTDTDEQKAIRNTEMFRFINQCQANCNNNNLCSGFTVQKLSSENAGTSGVPVGTMICNQRTSDAVPQPLEEDTSTSPPTMVRPAAIGGPQQSQCRKTEESSGDWATNWGYNNISEDFELTDPDLLRQYTEQPQEPPQPSQVRVIRPDAIPDNQPIYFEKTATPDSGTSPDPIGSIR